MMTNREKFEAEKTTFSKVMELFKKSGIADLNKFLKMPACKYKPGDLIVIELDNVMLDCHWKHEIVLEVLSCSCAGDCTGNHYNLKYLTPSENHSIGYCRSMDAYFIDNHTHLY